MHVERKPQTPEDLMVTTLEREVTDLTLTDTPQVDAEKETSSDLILPEEALCHVLSFLNTGDLRKFSQVSKSYMRFAMDPILLRNSVQRDFPFMCALGKETPAEKLFWNKHNLIKKLKSCDVKTQTRDVTQSTHVIINSSGLRNVVPIFVSFIKYEQSAIETVISLFDKDEEYICWPYTETLFGSVTIDHLQGYTDFHLVNTANSKMMSLSCDPECVPFEVYENKVLITSLSNSQIHVYHFDIVKMEVNEEIVKSCNLNPTVFENAYKKNGVFYYVDDEHRLNYYNIFDDEPKLEIIYEFPKEKYNKHHKIYIQKVEKNCAFFVSYNAKTDCTEHSILDLNTKLIRPLCESIHVGGLGGIEIANGLIFTANVTDSTITITDLDTGKEIHILQLLHDIDDTISDSYKAPLCEQMILNSYIKFENDTLYYFSRNDQGRVMHAIDFSKSQV